MDGEIRSIPGDRLVSRILTRARRRPRMGLSPDFYARFGMDDPWSAPEIAGEAGGDGDGFVYLSAQPYYAMMRRLAAARKRREKRLATFAERHSGTKVRALSRSWPGESAASLAVSRLARLALDEMTLPPAIPAAAAAPVEAVSEEPARRARWSGNRSTTRTNRGASAWWSAPVLPRAEREIVQVEVPAAPGETARPVARTGAATHAGARLARAAESTSRVARTLEEALPSAIGGARRRAVAQVAAELEALPPEQQAVELRRVLRRLGGAAPVVRTVYEDAPAARPADIAARRADAAPSAGLRPVLSRSPAMAIAAAPDLDRAASGTLAEAERSEDKRGLANVPRRAAAARRAAARASAGSPTGSSVPAPLAYARAVASAALSASPVTAPRLAAERAAAPRAVGAAGPERRSELGARTARAFRGEPTAAVELAAPARRSSRASARAVARLVAASDTGAAFFPEPLAAGANTAVRSAAGAWVSARALPLAERPAAVSGREASTFHAAARVEAGAVEGRSVVPRAIRSTPDRVLASAALPAAPSTVAALEAAPASAPLSASPVARTRAPRVISGWSASPSAVTASPVRTSASAGVAARIGEPVAAALTPSRRVLAPAALRTAAPAPSAAATSAQASDEVAPVSSAPRRASAVLHAGVRAEPRGASTPTRVAAASRAAPPTAPAAATGIAARAARPVDDASPRSARVRETRSAAMAYATARLDAPVETTLQPRVTSDRASAAVAPDRGAPAVTPERGASAAAPARFRAVRAARAASIVAADRAVRSPLLASSAAQALADQSGARATASPRFARSGPLAWALPALATAPAASPTAGATEGVASSPTARTARPTRRAPVTRAYAATDVAPISAVASPGGVYMSATAAARVPGVRLLRTEAGRLVAVVTAPEAPGAAATRGQPAGAAAARAAQSAGVAPRAARAAATQGAFLPQPFTLPVDDATDALVAPAAPARRRAAAWAAARTGVADATAYRGALRTPELVGPEAAAQAEAPASRTPARRDRPRRIAATAGDMALPTPASARADTGAASTLGDAPGAERSTVGARAAARAGRQPLEERLHGVAVGQPGAAAPTWAARSDGRAMVRSPGGLFEALAKATTTEEIVRVIYSRADGVRETPLAQEAPVVQVIEQIRQEVRREEAATEQATRAPRVATPNATTINSYVTPVASRTRSVRGSTRPIGATARGVTAGGGDDRIMKLVKKLQGLIHLAEMEGRLAEAKRQVRLAEDSPGARAEAQGPAGAAKEQGEKREKQDIEALGREVLEVVSRELELRRMRRLEDHDESVWW